MTESSELRIQQRSVVRFLTLESVKGKEIQNKLDNVFGPDTLV